MSAQETVLQQFREAYPQAKLKEISIKTGIQITRVFRILNGAEMKISEWEKFHSLSQTTTSIDNFTTLAKKCSLKISKERRKQIQAYMEQALNLSSFKEAYSILPQELSYEL